MTKKILVVDDEESIRFTFRSFLTEEGYEIATAANYGEAVALMAHAKFDLLFIDIIMEGKTGIDLLRTIKTGNPNAQVIIITGAPSVDTATEALRLGALDYIVKPIRQNELIKAARFALRHKQLSDEKDRCNSNVETIFKSVRDGIITVDEHMRVVDVNTAAMKLCGFRTDDAPGGLLPTMTGGCGGSCVDVLKEILATRKAVGLRHIECRRKNMQKQIISISGSPMIDHMNLFTGCVMVLRDETRLFHLEQNVKEDRAFNRLIGTSMQMKKVKDLIKALAGVQTTVLIIGESGTGKELVVEALHSAGDRYNKPLVKVNCGALADSILESELFGHVQGAFTGAILNKIGRFHLADGGIIFLDEIGDISPKMQLQLLRVIETMSFEQVGSSKTQRVDVRVVAATNKNLAQKVAIGEFRKDLYYRLKVVQLNLPPLRERKDDIPLLTSHMIEKFNHKFKKKIKAVSSDVTKLFLLHTWPGNVRELENTIEHAFILCNQNVITVSHLPIEFQNQFCGPSTFNNLNQDLEAQSIERALEQTEGNKAKAARMLSMSRRTIYRKMDKYKITG
ncbi:sigma-54-dependent Fis family transcriptional regulator [Desulfopila sp. IMCC35006]|uniref:sigma-54-dependent Fis family transcriptional regulator n=1 Tax=Desulfopila sp. IMCC35006 TaxID=2569542 RepID=UPI0010AC21ED|nr:sigma-54-dependent Fis family transcriptional regulator [Desulfopila sp. IMCC35006]TKB24479.1 sigma-54-dependent Fis family transcriptional regulator [Desulfopila sp. IMCC35006]